MRHLTRHLSPILFYLLVFVFLLSADFLIGIPLKELLGLLVVYTVFFVAPTWGIAGMIKDMYNGLRRKNG